MKVVELKKLHVSIKYKGFNLHNEGNIKKDRKSQESLVLHKSIAVNYRSTWCIFFDFI
jgi:hypothetical protein